METDKVTRKIDEAVVKLMEIREKRNLVLEFGLSKEANQQVKTKLLAELDEAKSDIEVLKTSDLENDNLEEEEEEKEKIKEGEKDV